MSNYRLEYSSDERFRVVLLAIKAIDRKSIKNKRKRVKVSEVQKKLQQDPALLSFESRLKKQIEDFRNEKNNSRK